MAIELKHEAMGQALTARRGRAGSVLMEVVIATSLFFVAGVFIMDGLNSAIRGVGTLKLEADAMDLAVTTFSEVQMGLTPLQSVGPVGVAFSGSEGWTYELIVSGLDDALEMPQLKKLEIVVRNDANEFAYRTTHLIWDNPNPLPAVPGVDQVPSDLASQIPGGVSDLPTDLLSGGAAGLGAAAGGGAGAGRPGGGRGGAGDATPAFPPRGNGANPADATPRFPQRPGTGNGGAPGDATPRFPQRPNGGNTPPGPPRGNGGGDNAPAGPPRGNGGNGNNGGNRGNPPDATPRFPQGGNGNGNGRGANGARPADATPRFPQGGNGKGGDKAPPRPTPPPTPPADGDEENQDKNGGAP